MSIITELGQFIPGSENYGHNEKNIAPLLAVGLLAAGGFAKGGGIEGITGGKKRREEEANAQREQKSRLFDYENFDYNQDVGAINNPYAEAGQRQLATDQQRIDQTQANQVQQLGRANQFGAATGIISQSARANQDAVQSATNIQLQGRQFVEQQRQSRIAQRYDQAGTFLARSEDRLAEATRARTAAKKSLYKGIGAGVTAGAGAIVGGGGLSALKKGGQFNTSGALKGSGLLPSHFYKKDKRNNKYDPVTGKLVAKYDPQTGELIKE